MMENSQAISLIPWIIFLLYLILDQAVSTLILFLPPTGAVFEFSLSNFLQAFHDFYPSKLSYCRLTGDFWLLAVIRTAIYAGIILGVIFGRSKNFLIRSGNLQLEVPLFERCSSLSKWLNLILMLMMIYSPLKLLAFDELDVDKKHALRFWLCFSWNLFSSIAIWGYWSSVLVDSLETKEQQSTDTKTKEVPVENGHLTTIDDDDRQPLTAADHLEITAVASDNTAIQAKRSKTDKEKSKKKKRKRKGKDDDEDEEDLPKLSTTASMSLLVRLLKYCKAQWHIYLLGFSALTAYSAAMIFIPYYVGQTIATIILTMSYEKLFHSVLMVFWLSCAATFFGGIRGGSFTYVISKIVREIRSDLFTSLVNQDIGFFDKTKTGAITSRLTADCQTMSDSVALNVNVFMRNTIMMVGSLIVMFKLSWQMTLLTFIAFPVVTVVSQVYGEYYEKLSTEVQDTLADANEVADEVIGSMRTVRSFANERGEAKRYWSKLTEVFGVNKKQTVAYTGYIWITEFFELMLVVAALWYGGHLVISKRLSSSDLLSFLLYQLQLGDNLSQIGYVWTGLMQSVGASRKVFEYIDRKPDILNNGTFAPTSTQVEGRIEFKNVRFSYPTRPDVEVLKDVSFTVSPGETVALVGPSGGGKSSCIALLEHFYEPSSGQVLIDHTPISKYDHHLLHNMASLVSQEPVLYGRSVAENIIYGLEDNAPEMDEIHHAAQLANAHTFIMENPDAYDTEVGEKGVQMSGGQKQRIAIARALIRRPKILLLDEATSALDSESEHLVQEAIYRNLAGHTVLLIAHRLSTVERADRIVVIDHGSVVQSGSHKELLKQGGLYKQLVQRQLLGHSISSAPQENAPNSQTEQQKLGSAAPISRSPVIRMESRGSSRSEQMKSPLSSSYRSASSVASSISASPTP